MGLLSLQNFDAIYQDVVDEVLGYWTPAMQEELAVHGHGWCVGSFDFERYLRHSSIRFYKAYSSCCGSARRICDMGGVWGAFPIMLRKLGFDVTITESLQYYSDGFHPLFQHITDHGVKIVDYDPFMERPAFRERFDVVMVMGGLERDPHSLKLFMSNAMRLMTDDGMLYIEAPNAAYLPKRLRLLIGRLSRAPLHDIHGPAIPFLSHHHEFMLDELRDLADLSGLTIVEEHRFNYSRINLSDIRSVARRPLEALLFTLFSGSRESLGVACRQNPATRVLRREIEEKLRRRRIANGEDADIVTAG